MTQFIGEYTQSAAIGLPGQNVSNNDSPDFFYRINSGDQTIETIATTTVGGTIGTETLTVSVVLNLPENPALAVTVTSIGSASLTTAALVGADLAAKLNANINFYRVAYASSVAGVISITVRDSQTGKNPILSVTNTKTGAATITASPAVTSFGTGSPVPYGYAVGETSTDTNTEARLYKAGVTILGIASLFRSSEQPYNPSGSNQIGITQVSPVDAIPAGGQLKIKRRGRIYVLALDAVTRGAQVFANDTTGQIQGSASGGTAIVGATFRTTTLAANQLAIVQL